MRSALEPDRYEIRMDGHVAHRWAARFDDVTLTLRPAIRPFLDGPIRRPSALHGLLRKVSGLGLPLVSVTPNPASDDDL